MGFRPACIYYLYFVCFPLMMFKIIDYCNIKITKEMVAAHHYVLIHLMAAHHYALLLLMAAKLRTNTSDGCSPLRIVTPDGCTPLCIVIFQIRSALHS